VKNVGAFGQSLRQGILRRGSAVISFGATAGFFRGRPRCDRHGSVGAEKVSAFGFLNQSFRSPDDMDFGLQFHSGRIPNSCASAFNQGENIGSPGAPHVGDEICMDA
jgi:hypothetical protein